MSAQPALAVPIQNQMLPAGQKKLRLSHSRKQVMVTCGKMYQYRYVDRLEPRIKGATLGFGSAMHSALSAFLTAQAFGVLMDPAPVFLHEWKAFTVNPVSYSSIWSEEKLIETGRVLLTKFVKDWEERGWTPVLDKDGLPLVERELEITLPSGITYIVIIDAVVRTREGKILVLDFKTPGKLGLEGFSSVADQLLGYQVAVNAHAANLGIGKVDGLVFYELVKRPVPKSNRGEGPSIHVEEPVPARPDKDVEEWIEEIRFIVGDIRSRRFSRRPMDAWNTPCALCDFHFLCTRGFDDNITTRDKKMDVEKEDPVQLVII